MLRSEPSFSVYSDSADGVREEDLMMGKGEISGRRLTTGDGIAAMGSDEFSFVKQSDNAVIKEEDDEGVEGEEDEKAEGFNGARNKRFGEEGERGKGFHGDGELRIGREEIKKREGQPGENLSFEEENAKRKAFNVSGKLVIGEVESQDTGAEQGLDRNGKLGFEGEIERPVSPPMHLATGLGIDKFDFNGNGIMFDLPSFGDENCDEYYKRMLDDYPLHPLLLRNYAKFLEYKRDLHGAEDYYHRCTLVEPGDGENLVNYAKLVWRLHRDQSKALHYFERAVQASPDDCDVLAARASFLWEMGDDDDDGNDVETNQFGPHGEQKRDSSLAQAEMEDGETMCRYAKSFWEIHRDRERASFYFEKAVEASPEESNILAAYARFLWEADEQDEEEDQTRQDEVSIPLPHICSMPAENIEAESEAS